MTAPKITYQDTGMRQAISPGEILPVTLCFLATGIYNVYIYISAYTHVCVMFCIAACATFESLQYLYDNPTPTIGKIVPGTCIAIISGLSKNHLKVSITHTVV